MPNLQTIFVIQVIYNDNYTSMDMANWEIIMWFFILKTSAETHNNPELMK